MCNALSIINPYRGRATHHALLVAHDHDGGAVVLGKDGCVLVIGPAARSSVPYGE